MRAIVVDSGGALRMTDWPLAPAAALAPGDARVRVHAVSFNPVDVQLRRGLIDNQDASPILGRDLSGVIEAVHPEVREFKAGDAVYGYVARRASSGSCAEVVDVPAELLARKPRALTHAQAAAVPVAAITAALALEKVRAERAGSLLLIGGAGGVGSFVLMLARRLGVRRLFATAGSAASRAHLTQFGALDPAQVLDWRASDFVAQALARNGGPFDAVIDLAGGATLRAGLALLAIDGHLASAVEAPDAAQAERLFERNASFHAIGAQAYSLADERATWRRYQRLLTNLAADFDAARLPAPPVQVVGPFTVESVQRAHALLERSAVQGKLVMTVDGLSRA